MFSALGAFRGYRIAIGLLIGMGLVVLAAAPGARADKVVALPGSEAGQVAFPHGIAVETNTNRVYVAEAGTNSAEAANNRVSVFDSSGAFLFAFGWGVATGTPQLETCTTSCRPGIGGNGPGQLNGPTGLAIDSNPLAPAVYVVSGTKVVKFSPSGDFLSSFGTAGDGDGEFNEVPEIAVGPNGRVMLADRERLQEFEPDGDFLASIDLANCGPSQGLAVDSSGAFYIATEAGACAGVQKYAPDGAPLYFRSISDVNGLAVDTAENVYVTSLNSRHNRSNIIEYDSSGDLVRVFSYGFPPINARGIAVASSGEVWTTSYALAGCCIQWSRVLISTPPPVGRPVVLPSEGTAAPVGQTTATLNAFVNPEGNATTYHFDYVPEAEFEAEGFDGPGAKSTPEAPLSGAVDFALHEASAAVSCDVPSEESCLEPGTDYRFRLVATNDKGTAEGPSFSFATNPPFEILTVWSQEVRATEATFGSEVNPLGLPATGVFEYVDQGSFEADGFDSAAKAPSTPIDIGSGSDPVAVTAEVSGLRPGTVYHYRFVVANSMAEAPGAEESVRTFALPVDRPLPDGRAYEMATPPDKRSGEVASRNSAAGFANESVLPVVATPDGSAITYGSFTAFSDPISAPAVSQYIARRGGTGWTTTNITPRDEEGWTRDPFRAFTEDLSFGALAVIEPALSPGVVPGYETAYRYDAASDALLPTAKRAPGIANLQNKFEYCTGVAGMSEDGSHIIFMANGALTPNSVEGTSPSASKFNLYDWSASKGMRLVNVLTNNVAATPTALTGFVAGISRCVMNRPLLRHVISQDGSRIFWGTAQSAGDEQLFARVNGAETVQIDLNQGGSGPSGGGVFLGASADGSKVYFNSKRALTPDAVAAVAGERGNLYRYDFDEPLGERLTDVSVPDGGASSSADVAGLLDLSEDGQTVYFVAGAVLAENDGAATDPVSGQPQRAQLGENNLYVWSAGSGIRFIATLDGARDPLNWGTELNQTATATADGRHLAFLSSADLLGYDNKVAGAAGCEVDGEGNAKGAPQCAEAYLYSLTDSTLVCASCNPTGARPAGSAGFPPWSTAYQQPRFLSDDGSRLFFESRDALAPGDENDLTDVYQYERPGTGSCTVQSAGYSAAQGGCIDLLSSGTSQDDSYLVDASRDGEDAFISTRQQLLPRDWDERYDIYDARVNGGFAEPPVPPRPCADESCRGPGSAPPVSTDPPTSTLADRGNVHAKKPKPKRCERAGKAKHGKHGKRGKVHCGKAKKHARHHRTAKHHQRHHNGNGKGDRR